VRPPQSIAGPPRRSISAPASARGPHRQLPLHPRAHHPGRHLRRDRVL